jgi:hypothetical protein
MINNRGFITIDYLFSFVLVSGFCLAIMAFSATLSVVETVQYVAFTGARNFFAGHVDVESQKSVAMKKMISGQNAIGANPVLAPLINGGWFKVDWSKAVVEYDIPQNAPSFGYESPNPNRSLFHGVILPFQANILAFQVPFFGSTVKSDDQQSKDALFSTNITAFLGREPTFKECNDFNQARWTNIQKLDSSYKVPSGATANGYVVINDNGC